MQEIPVFLNDILIERVDRQRAQRLAKAPNAIARRDKRTLQIVAVIVQAHGSDYDRVSRWLNPRKYSHKKETRDNVRQCWTLRRLRPEMINTNAPTQP